ncbi:MAG: L,D-transpeptidase family protein [Rhodoferax sp.]|jgi:murein L,D-transpeptidase YafK|nr:L,D-transpeptidase family protein [Rhodoferax sp.]
MRRYAFFPVLVAVVVAFSTSAGANTHKKKVGKSKKAASTSPAPLAPPVDPGLAESRLIEVYQLVARSESRQALERAQNLVRDYPHFQLAQLVYGDLLSARIRHVQTVGDVPESISMGGATALSELRDESQLRLRALRERPPVGAVPSQFLALSSRNRHAIAIDASRSRLYLFENKASGLTLIGDYYISIGKSGYDKKTEGDSRTPLGVYFITGSLDPRSLKDYYGSGALPINYPNELDNRRGKTGSGIWLHGTPANQFSRPPQASDGCVVLANPDLAKIIRTVQSRTTPVVIAPVLQWIAPNVARQESKPFEAALAAWQSAKSRGNMDQVLSFYSADFHSNGKTLTEWTPGLRSQLAKTRGRAIELKDLSMLRWTDAADTMVVTFGEVAEGSRSGPMRRQYWERQRGQWKIFYEGVIG